MSDRLTMQVLENGYWLDVATRAKTFEGMKRVYRRMSQKGKRSALGMRVIVVKFEHLGAFVGKARAK